MGQICRPSTTPLAPAVCHASRRADLSVRPFADACGVSEHFYPGPFTPLREPPRCPVSVSVTTAAASIGKRYPGRPSMSLIFILDLRRFSNRATLRSRERRVHRQRLLSLDVIHVCDSLLDPEDPPCSALDDWLSACVASNKTGFPFWAMLPTNLSNRHPTPSRIPNGPLPIPLLLDIVIPAVHPAPPLAQPMSARDVIIGHYSATEDGSAGRVPTFTECSHAAAKHPNRTGRRSVHFPPRNRTGS
jgi:hypothetical protein